MKYLMLESAERSALLEGLLDLAGFLELAFQGLSPDEERRPGPGESFSPVEQCWHLADLEQEGFGVRIERLLREREPRLPDFDGARLARERDYRSRSLRDGLAAFREARRRNVAALRALRPADWERRGTQEGVGPVALCDIPALMAQHDASHRAEIEAWTQARR